MPLLNNTVRSEIITSFARAGIAQGSMVRTASARATADTDGLLWVLTTEQPATVFDWDRWDFVSEVLLMDGMVLPAIKQVPLLDSHNRASVDDHLGSVTDLILSTAGGFRSVDGRVRFAADDKSQRTAQKVLDGHITDGSVGYRVDKSIWIPEGTEATIKGHTFAGPVKVSHEWILKEFSITPIGADTLAKVRSLCTGLGGRSVNPRLL
jgi:hypothetical protein